MMIEGPFEPKYSVLIVDDDSLSREVLSVLLDAEGYETRTAANGEDALTLLTALSFAGTLPQAVLADLQMPGLAGNALAERLRSSFGQSFRLIVMSAGEPEASLVSRYDRFLRKPIDVESLVQALGGLAQAGKAEFTGFCGPGSETLDEAIHAKLTAAMSLQQTVDVYRFFVADALQRVERMRIAAGLRDEADFRKEAHTLHGGCGMLGASEMRKLAASLEQLGFGDRTRLELETLLEDLAEACERLRSMLEARWRRNA